MVGLTCPPVKMPLQQMATNNEQEMNTLWNGLGMRVSVGSRYWLQQIP